MNKRSIHRLALAAFALTAGACQKPEAPTVTPKEARVVAVSPAGLDILVKVEAMNPNSVTLSAQSLTGRAKLDGKWDMGAVTIAKPVALAPKAATTIDVPMTMPWADLRALGALAAAQRPVPYVVEGTVKIGGEHLAVDVPFAVSGTLTREQLANAALKSLPPVPGLTIPP